jgi:BirA family transcriptional regulator, biotin operon repressor / biotin---[acetyl-CoA-carboxylase] ligase
MNNNAKIRFILNEIDSTNNYANSLIMSKAAEEGTVVLAYNQLSGRGQQGNRWESESGKNLLASLVLFPEFLPVTQQFQISKLVSLGICEFLSSETENISIKWPNDIYIGNKKICGVLIENAVKGQNLLSVVAGIGLNLNQEIFYSDAPNPVSLKQVTGKEYDIIEVACKIKSQIMDWYVKLRNGNSEEIDKAYLSRLYRLNNWANYKTNELVFEGKITGTGEFGKLFIKRRNGEISSFLFKEVEFV